MITVTNAKLGQTRNYDCTTETLACLCKANIECLLKIALGDSDEHIERLGGEQKLLDLMNGYMDLLERIRVEL